MKNYFILELDLRKSSNGNLLVFTEATEKIMKLYEG